MMLFAEAQSPYVTIIASLISGFGGVMITAIIAWHKRKGQLYADIKAIKDQVFPNGGGSMRDAINRMEEQQHIDTELRRAFNFHVNIAMWEADEAGHVVWSNAAFAKLLGVSTEDLRGHGWLSYVAQEDLMRVKHEIVQGGSHDHYMDYRVHRPKPQGILKLKTRWKRVTNHAGKTVRFVGSVLANQEDK
jgi:PAS domain S-box-containing protein